MLYQSDFPHVTSRTLADGLSIHGMAQSVVAGIRPGHVLTDDPEAPRSLFIGAPEGTFAWTYLAGDAKNDPFVGGLRDWLLEEKGLGKSVGFTFLACATNDWEEIVARMIGPRMVIPDRRLHYVCSPVPSEISRAPAGYEILALDRELLESDVSIPETVADWLDANFGSRDGYLKHGFGAVAVRENAVVAWCLTDSVGQASCDIGVETEEAHRKRGLASLTTAHVLQQAVARGLRQVGWHCHAINVPSVKTAESAGFRMASEYVLYPIQFDVEKHAKLVEIVAAEFAQDVREALARGAGAEAARLSVTLLRLASEESPEPFVLAARAAAAAGETECALTYLETATAAGWLTPADAEGLPELARLIEDPRWQELAG